MNWTNIEHTLYALGMQAVIGLLTGDWWAGAALGAGFFLGREHSQAEERYIAAHGGKRYETPMRAEWAVLVERRWWDIDSLLDWVMPAIAVVAVALIASASWS